MAKKQSECDPEKPDEAFQWMFAAGVPDPRGNGQFPNQPLIPPACYGVLSEMLWKMGARFHPELQELWVEAPSGPAGNFMVAKTSDVRPEDIEGDVAEMVADQFPEVAEQVAAVKPDKQAEALEATAQKLLKNLADLKAARERFDAAGGDA